MSGKKMRGTRGMVWLLSRLGYLLYALVVLLCLLWLMFPARAVQDWLAAQFHRQYPGYALDIGSLELVLPGGLVFGNVVLRSAASKKAAVSRKGLVRIRRAAFFPVPKSLFAESKIVRYRLELLVGSVSGQGVVQADWHHFLVKGHFKDLQLKKLSVLQKELGRVFAGRLFGTFLLKGSRNEMAKASVEGTLQLRDGRLSFKKPVLGLAELPFSEIKTELDRRDGHWFFKGGTIQSPLLAGRFSGSLQLAEHLLDSRFQGKGTLSPRPEMFVGARKMKMAELVRAQLKDGVLPFTVAGTLATPSVRFDGLSVP